MFWSCPSVKLMSPFNLNSYAGVWYESTRDRAILFETGDCVQVKYTKDSNGDVRVKNTQREPGYTAVNYVIEGTGYTKNDRHPELYVKFFWFAGGDYQVVDTDYTNYAIVRSCSNYIYGIIRDEVFWILVRSVTPDPAIIAQAKQTIKNRAPHYDLNNL